MGVEQTFNAEIEVVIHPHIIGEDRARERHGDGLARLQGEVFVEFMQFKRSAVGGQHPPGVCLTVNRNRRQGGFVPRPLFFILKENIGEVDVLIIEIDRSRTIFGPCNVHQTLAFIGLPKPSIAAVEWLKTDARQRHMPPSLSSQSQLGHVCVGQRQQRFIIMLNIDERDLEHFKQRSLWVERGLVFSQRHHVFACNALQTCT